MTHNPEGYIAIGDIHGCIKTLNALLERLTLEYGTDRTFVFLGDMVDRGPDSKKVIERLIEFSKTHTCEFVRGNHDQMLLNYYADNSFLDYLSSGGAQTLESYIQDCPDGKIPYAHLKFLMSTKLYVEAEHWVFVHGGLPPELPVREALDDASWHDSFLWERRHLEKEHNEWEKTVVFGHTPVREPIIKDNMIGIDTGCVYKQFGKLTAVVLPEREFIQQKRIDF